MIDTLRDFLRTRYNREPLVRGHMPVLEKASKAAKAADAFADQPELHHFGPVLARLEQMSQRF